MPARGVHGFGWGLALAAWVAACTPDTPRAFEPGMPAAALALLEPDTVRETPLHPGVVYRYLWSAHGPWAVHVVQAAVPGRCELAFEVLIPEVRTLDRDGHGLVSEMVADSPDRVLAAVNADFFTPEGRTVGTEVVDGVVRTAADRPTFAWRRGAPPWMGVAQVDRESLRLGWPVDLDEGDRLTEAVGGFPDLIDGGMRVGDLEVAERPAFAAARHPRSAVGYDSERGLAWLVLVDGRQVPYSAGMSLPELAQLMEALGADEAINLDGGGSSALVLDGSPVNRPSDATGERPVVNALALVTDPSGCPAASGLSRPR